MPAVFTAVASVLAPGGRFAFNIGRQFIMLPFTEEETSRSKPSLSMYAEAIAILDHDYVAPLGRRRGRLLSRDIVEEMLTASGLRLEAFDVLGYESTADHDAAWLRIPIFADNILYGMPYEQQVDVIDRAYERVDKTAVSATRWAYFVTTASR